MPNQLVPNSTDDQSPILQNLLDEAAKTEANVYLPSGTFLCADIKIPPHVGLIGQGRWSYAGSSGTRLALAHNRAGCLLNVANARQSRLEGLVLDGRRLGHAEAYHHFDDEKGKLVSIDGDRSAPHEIHGVMLHNPLGHHNIGENKEIGLFIDRCHVENFSGDGIHLGHIHYFRVRQCHIFCNAGAGIRVQGWDGFFLDNCISQNAKGGFVSFKGRDWTTASMTFTANRIEWCAAGGIIADADDSNSYILTGNFFDRCGGYALEVNGGESFTVTGNLFRRSSRPEWTADDAKSAHVSLRNASSVCFTGNNFQTGMDDGFGQLSPNTSIILENLKGSVVTNNCLYKGSLKDPIRDLGGHTGTLIEHNVY